MGGRKSVENRLQFGFSPFSTLKTHDVLAVMVMGRTSSANSGTLHDDAKHSQSEQFLQAPQAPSV
ncbi:MAG: hypothetical protein P8104_13520 [Gammaproteobacteria bacterium]